VTVAMQQCYNIFNGQKLSKGRLWLEKFSRNGHRNSRPDSCGSWFWVRPADSVR